MIITTQAVGQLVELLLPTPAGDLAVLLTAQDAVVRAAGFADSSHMAGRLAAALRDSSPTVSAADVAEPGVAAVVDAVARYTDGELGALDAVLVEQPGGPFQQRAWQAMRRIAPGAPVTYRELATEAGNPAAVRAAGSACARNLIAPFVPCHRVLRTDGSLGGYYYGTEVKQLLLRHEERHSG